MIVGRETNKTSADFTPSPIPPPPETQYEQLFTAYLMKGCLVNKYFTDSIYIIPRIESKNNNIQIMKLTAENSWRTKCKQMTEMLLLITHERTNVCMYRLCSKELL